MGKSFTDSIISLPLPVRLYQLGSQWLIEWLCKGEGNPVNQSFLKQLKRSQENQEKAFSVYREAEVPREDIQPALFIFHVSRCGSTLAANYLATDEANRVHNEPNILGKLYSDLNDGSTDVERDFVKHINTLTMGALPQQRRLIVKLSSRYLKYVELFDRFYPEVPKWLIVRNPTEVLASNVMYPPDHILNQIEGEYSEKKCIPVVLSSWANTYRDALQYKESFTTILDYKDILMSLQSIETDLWDAETSEQRKRLIDSVLSKSSKNSTKEFDEDLNKKLAYRALFSIENSDCFKQMERDYARVLEESS